jgi:hypothetical protein
MLQIFCTTTPPTMFSGASAASTTPH